MNSKEVDLLHFTDYENGNSSQYSANFFYTNIILVNNMP